MTAQYGECIYDQVPSIDLPIKNMEAWSGKQIDPVSNLRNRQIYLEVGNFDTTVGPHVVTQLAAQLNYFDTSSSVAYVTTVGAGHTFPTDFDGAGNNPCDASESPYISNCGYDGAGAVLTWMYGTLHPRNDGTLKGRLQSFEQTGPFAAAGLAATGYVFVPAACQNASSCRLHVVLHGCGQSYDIIGPTFIENTGYNMWAGEKPIGVADIQGRDGIRRTDRIDRHEQYYHPVSTSHGR